MELASTRSSERTALLILPLCGPAPIISENKIKGLRGLVIDITERKKAEETLNQTMDELVRVNEKLELDMDITKRKEQEDKNKTEEIDNIVDGIGDLLFVMDKNRVITRVNKSTCEALKKKPEELLGRHCYEVVHGTERSLAGVPRHKDI